MHGLKNDSFEREERFLKCYYWPYRNLQKKYINNFNWMFIMIKKELLLLTEAIASRRSDEQETLQND